MPSEVFAQTTLFSDNFNSGALDLNKWRKGTNAGNQAAVVNNALDLKSNGAESGWVITKNSYVAGNTMVSVKVAQPNNDGDLGMSPTYNLSSPNGILSQTNWYRFNFYRSGSSGPYRLFARWKKNGVVSGLEVTGNLVINGVVYLRLRFDNTNIHFEASLDGTTWIDAYTEAFSLPGYTLSSPFYYELAAYKTATNGVMTVDDFAINSSDTQPPIISSVAATSITASAATIDWNTDEASDSQVEYGLTTSYGNTTPLNASLVISHSVSLSGLSANTLYHYRVRSKDAAGNLATSADGTFTTSAPVQGNVAFANVQGIFDNQCVRCHQGATAPAGLVLLAGQSHGNIVNVPSTEYPQWQRVQPGNRAISWLYEKITNPTPPVGSKMGSLSPDEIALIGTWIDQGATAVPSPPYADLEFRTTTLVNGEIDISYYINFVVWGGLPPYQFSVMSGTLPPGIALDPTGFLFGAPTTPGSYSFTIGVSDNQSPAATLDQAYSIEIFNTQDHWQLPADFVIENVVDDLHLPVNLAFVPNPGPNPTDPYFYVTLLYGDIVMVQRNFQKQTYATGLLNFVPTGEFPGSGEMGVIGITVEPLSGDVFASMVYDDGTGYFFNKVVRFHSADGGRTAATQTTILSGIPSIASHQIQALTIGPDGKLYVNVGDSGVAEAAPNLDDLRGKILRMNLDGAIPPDNPFPNSYVYASGLRNPFGAAWRQKDGGLYISDNGPEIDDRLAKIFPGADYGWGLEMPDLTKGAIFLWNPTVSPVGMDFLENTNFPSAYHNQLFVGRSGGTYQPGYSSDGKKIQRFALDDTGTVVSETVFLDYAGFGWETVIGLAFGPDGLYFTDLYGENGFDEFGQTHANIYRIRWTGADSSAGGTLFADDFNDGALDPFNWKLGANAGNQSGVVNAALELRSTGVESGWVITTNAYSARNTTASVKVTQPNNDGDLGISPAFNLASTNGIFDQPNWYRFYAFRSGGAGSYRLYVQWKKSGVNGDIDVTGNLVINGTVYLRLRFDDTNIHFEASLDNLAWTDTYTEAFALPGYTLDSPFYYELAAYKTGSNGVLIADDFSIIDNNSGIAAKPNMCNS